jgi:hypothetical protein
MGRETRSDRRLGQGPSGAILHAGVCWVVAALDTTLRICELPGNNGRGEGAFGPALREIASVPQEGCAFLLPNGGTSSTFIAAAKGLGGRL